MHQDDYYDRYIERLCICISDGLVTESSALQTARTDILQAMKEGGVPIALANRWAGEIKQRAISEGIL